MSVTTHDRAALCKDSYEDHSTDKGTDKVFLIGKDKYKILDTYNDPITGYQGTAYLRLGPDHKPTGAVVISHRGTESILDGVVDAGMVLTGLNAQIPDAEAFTKRAMQMAKALPELQGKPLDITVTGHSLGGTLAEYTAHKFHLRGETFNAYGAAGLMHGVPEGGTQVINHVRATDVVSAASKHYGEVRVLATKQDIDGLHNAGFHDDGSGFWRNTLRAADPSAHGIANFVPDAQGHSALDPENAKHYLDHRSLVDRYRDDVLMARTALSAKWELEKKVNELGQAVGKAAVEGTMAASKTVGEAAAQGAHAIAHTAEQVGRHGARQAANAISAAYDATRDAAVQGAKVAGQTAAHVGQAVSQSAQVFGQQAARAGSVMSDGLNHVGETLRHPESLLGRTPTRPAAHLPPVRLDDPAHPGHTMFRQGLDGVQQLNAKHGVAPSPRDSRIAGALTVVATAQGFSRIDQVLLNNDASRVFAIQGSPQRFDQRFASVDTMTAIKTPLEQSSSQWPQAAQQHEQNQRAQQALRQPVHESPSQAMGHSR